MLSDQVQELQAQVLDLQKQVDDTKKSLRLAERKVLAMGI